MRVAIVIDDHLMQEAMRVSGLTTNRAVVESGLKLLIQIKRQSDIRKLRGNVQGIAEDYDDKKMPEPRF